MFSMCRYVDCTICLFFYNMTYHVYTTLVYLPIRPFFCISQVVPLLARVVFFPDLFFIDLV